MDGLGSDIETLKTPLPCHGGTKNPCRPQLSGSPVLLLLLPAATRPSTSSTGQSFLDGLGPNPYERQQLSSQPLYMKAVPAGGAPWIFSSVHQASASSRLEPLVMVAVAMASFRAELF